MIINAMFNAEAIRTAMAKYGNQPLTGEEVRWRFEEPEPHRPAALGSLDMKGCCARSR